MASIVDEQAQRGGPNPDPDPNPNPNPIPNPNPNPNPNSSPNPSPNPESQVRRGGFADNILGLVGLYLQLTANTALETRSPLLCLALLLTLGSSGYAVQLLAQSYLELAAAPADAATAAATSAVPAPTQELSPAVDSVSESGAMTDATG